MPDFHCSSNSLLALNKKLRKYNLNTISTENIAADSSRNSVVGSSNKKNTAIMIRNTIDGAAISMTVVIGRNGLNPENIIILWLMHGLWTILGLNNEYG